MPYDHGWYIEGRIIAAQVWGDQDIDEITRSSQELMAKLDAGTPLVHLLMDDSRLGKVPVNLGQLGNALAFARHQNLGWVIMIGEGSRVTKFVVEMLGKIFRINIRRVARFEDAIRFLKERDISVPWQEAAEKAEP
jgi:hypothetical protein